MLEPDFNPAPTAVQIGRCGYPSQCRAPRCEASRAAIVLRKIHAAGRPVRQIELCSRHAEACDRSLRSRSASAVRGRGSRKETGFYAGMS